MARTFAGSARVRATAEVVGWWAVLTGLWLVLISRVDLLEWVVGSCASLLAAFGARAARLAATGRNGSA
ncbi:hypothetical protein CG723_22470 [Streptomyces sp. CB01635]|uniref:hypothetical protein n=1 Tax=unclassified Streptomyces TaxID=2593676 RepID=UPI000C27E1CF|nr:hypothetical protein [Streptomyces sp. CB01635]PJN09514.1 hypothetical protein CG723_22470 [Streptomyces sp. CB01635]